MHVIELGLLVCTIAIFCIFCIFCINIQLLHILHIWHSLHMCHINILISILAFFIFPQGLINSGYNG